MTARITMDQSDDADRFDVLSADEEGALCLVRQIVAGARARGMATDIEALGRAVIEAGASRQGDEAGRELSTFRLRGARFSLARSEEHTSELPSLRHLVCR